MVVFEFFNRKRYCRPCRAQSISRQEREGQIYLMAFSAEQNTKKILFTSIIVLEISWRL